jgi:very-short-patch-repair endonuclease
MTHSPRPPGGGNIVKNMLPYKKSLVGNAKILRRNMTPEEKHLWYDFLKKLTVPVKRQKNVENYILDFYIPQYKIAIEIDGGQHYTREGKEADKTRDNALKRWGIRVLRYTNADIKTNFNGVAQDILLQMEKTE